MSFNVSTSFRLDQGRIARMLRLRGGLVDRDLRQRVERVQRTAERLAPGSMGRTITSSIRYGPDGPHGSITVHHPAALYVVNGTRPHVIWPHLNRPRPHLRFMVNGRAVYARVVFHPGTRPNDFMLRALREAL